MGGYNEDMNKNIVINEYELPLVVKKDGIYFIAICPDWPDCYAQGNSAMDASKAAVEVAKSLIEIYEEEEKMIPLKIRNKNRTGISQNFKPSVMVPVS